MTQTTIGALREVQKLDERIREIRTGIAEFDERLAAAEEPALLLEKELSQLRERLAQMRADARRLERAADDKRGRREKLDQRLTRVSNLREEAAVRTELDLVRRAMEADEQEAIQLFDQIRRMELAEEELVQRTEAAREEAEAGQAALLSERDGYESRMATLESRRAEILGGVTSLERRVYDAFHQSGRLVVVASLLEDGACGHCFGVVPLQVQNEIRNGEGLVRCEACGVILTTEQPTPEADPEGGEGTGVAAESDAGDEEEAAAGDAGAEESSEEPDPA